MTAHRLLLEEQVQLSKALAFGNPTRTHMAAYGRAIMDSWEAEAVPLTKAWSRRPRYLQVGDHVRVRSDPGTLIDCSELPHFTAEAGCTGRICAEQTRWGIRDHPLFVMFDRPVPTVITCAGVMPLHARHYALAELELVV